MYVRTYPNTRVREGERDAEQDDDDNMMVAMMSLARSQKKKAYYDKGEKKERKIRAPREGTTTVVARNSTSRLIESFIHSPPVPFFPSPFPSPSPTQPTPQIALAHPCTGNRTAPAPHRTDTARLTQLNPPSSPPIFFLPLFPDGLDGMDGWMIRPKNRNRIAMRCDASPRSAAHPPFLHTHINFPGARRGTGTVAGRELGKGKSRVENQSPCPWLWRFLRQKNCGEAAMGQLDHLKM